MKKLLALLLGLLVLPAWAQTGISTPELAPCDAAVQEFMARWNIPGASVAIARHGKLVYARGFGHANLARTKPMTPAHLLRVASVSKPVTAVAVMKLVEEGQLELRHKVFGPGGYLDLPYYTDVVTDRRIYDITVQQLLEHSAGWNHNAGVDGFSGSDPIDFPLHVARVMRVPNPVGDSTLVRYLLSKGLNFTPGSRFAYSNIGYLVLGKIIERVTGQRYETWVRRHVLAPAGVLEAHLGHNLRANKLEREAEYFCETTNKSCYGTGKRVPFAYGGANLEAMNAHGGWLFTARDLVRLVLAVDGSPTRPDILQPATLDTMTTPSAANRRYAKGWMVNRRGTWWHTGCLNGSVSSVVRTANGYTWAILLNSFPNTNRFWNDLEDLGWTCITEPTAWPSYDLFPPENNATQLQAVPTNAVTTLSWSPSDGTHRLVLVREEKPVDAFPQDGQVYTSSRMFGLGDVLGKGNVVVATGADSTVQVRGLRPGHTYYARVVEYYANETTSQQPVYTLEGNPVVRFRVPEAALLAKAKPKAKRPNRAIAASKNRLKTPSSAPGTRSVAPNRVTSAPRTADAPHPSRIRSLLAWRKG